MPEHALIAERVREIVRRHLPAVATDAELGGDIPLGSEGLGLDSIAMAEVVLECEDRFGVNASELLQKGPLTIDALVRVLR